MLNRRGDIPIVLLVVLTVVIFGLMLILFFVVGERAKGDVKGFEKVQEFNSIVEGAEFVGGSLEGLSVEKFEGGWYGLKFWDKKLKIRVEELGR